MQPGDVVSGRFELVELAGTGGMGVVFRATDRHDGKTVAVKLLSGGPEDRERFAREAAMLEQIQHPAIVRLVAHGDAAGEPYLVMEWVQGESLGDRLARTGLDVTEAVAMLARVAAALAAVHHHGVIHRDLKPANILFEAGALDRVKLIDFGVARSLKTAHVLTLTGMMVGTPGYMSPEQARAEGKIDTRADVFSLGCVLYECLTGWAPFAGESSMAIRTKIISVEPPDVKSRCPEITPALEALLLRMLAKQPDDRPRDAGEVATALGSLGELPGGQRRPTNGDQTSTVGLRGKHTTRRTQAKLWLVVIAEGVQTTHALPEAGDVVIGRGDAVDLRIDHRSVSISHARLHLGDPVTIEDLASKNGTRVRDEPIAPNVPTEVAVGQAIRLGTVVAIVTRR